MAVLLDTSLVLLLRPLFAALGPSLWITGLGLGLGLGPSLWITGLGLGLGLGLSLWITGLGLGLGCDRWSFCVKTVRRLVNLKGHLYRSGHMLLTYVDYITVCSF